ncbi:hypothetical protein GDO78_011718 [Eleutherodactylus coqui]|uniref:Pericentriolar material 1 protein C-terminal domain-containing protein n=1 Tax=Eleutherodactylus coqui TaxID=57060 RepID=A0A8J6F1M3_ELECQ|nr:hypothetical protein GDO78_011718 [Eleutherodactylus coqui]KAG9479832.1 hypothetical protein GDO78_011718 [Eleutherodactylus coqui]KAG9479833.1 hypothetical protein GDO78_011718 [Eleutherodactylus coqui]
MATGGGPPEETLTDQDLPNWSHESLEDRLNNMEWSGQKKANRSSEKNKKKFGMDCESRLTNDISPGSSPGVGRRRTRTPHTYPHTRYVSQMSVPEQAELERLKQKINFGDLDQRSIGSDSQGRATAANNKRQLSENKKPFNFLPLQLNTNKDKPASSSPPKQETSISSLTKDFLSSPLSKELLQNYQAALEEDGPREPAADRSQAIDPQQEAKEELKNMKKQHALLTRMLQQQEQLRALKGRQAALLALQHKAEQAIAVMDESVVTETTGSVSGLSLTSELNEELNDLIQRFHNQLHDAQSPPVPDNRRQAESLSLTTAVSQSLNSSISELPSEERGPLFSKVGVKQKMDSILGELHTLQDHHLNNTAFVGSSDSPRRVTVQRSIGSTSSTNQVSDKRTSSSPAARATAAAAAASMNGSEDEENQNPAEKLKKLKEVRKRLNELRDLVRYYEQTSDMITDAVNENTKEEEEETEDSWIESDQEVNQPLINIRNPQRMSSWGAVNGITNSQCGVNNRDERPCNTDCEINNRSAANLRSFTVSSALECLYNRDTKDKREDRIEGLGDDDDGDEDPGSAASLSSRSSVTEDDQNDDDDDFEERFNRLIATKQKLRQLQDLVAMYGDDTESETAVERPTGGAHLLPEEASANQQPNNTRPNASKAQKDVALKEQTREKFYETKLQQQQQELKQLHEERKKLIEIQEKIQTLRKACPDLQLSTSNAGTSVRIPTAPSTPEVNDDCPLVLPSMPDPEDSSSADNEVWSEIRRHQILREDLRQRRKQLESLMAEHQRRQGITDTNSAGSLRSDGSETHSLQHQSRTEKTMATWGGSTQCALDDDDEHEDEEEACISDVNQAEEEEEEEDDEQENTFRENVPYPPSSINQSAFSGKNNKHGWNNQRSYSVDGNYRPSPKTRQQQNISMRRQENVQWVSELSQVEEKEHWQEQINQLKKQLDFSTNICQTLMRDQQSLSYLLQSLFTNPYTMMPNSMGTPQVHLVMHQLNQCYTQLNWQQNNIQRLKQMLNDLHQQQEQFQHGQERGSSAPPPSTPNILNNFSFLPSPMNMFNMPPFGNFPNMMPGVNFNPVFQPGIGDFTYNATSQPDVPLQPHDPNISGKTEYMAFPKPFESNSPSTADKQRNSPKATEDGEHSRHHRLENQNKDQGTSPPFMDPEHSAFANSVQQSRQCDEESVESLSSLPGPLDPTTVTKIFKSQKASAQASLASKDKTPKTKNKKRKICHRKSKALKNHDLHSASVSGSAKSKESSNKHAQTEQITETNPSCDHIERLRRDNRTVDVSSEAGSDFSMFEALRDTIYSEVATLISQNECRPHFLIELFHELQLLNTDYLRQKALFALQDIVTRRVTEATDKHDSTKPVESIGWMQSNSELTPSESLATTDDEMYTKNSNGPACNEAEQNDGDNLSNLSTSSNFEPFATDDLGNTVIHLDQALARMREYERMKLESENNLTADSCNNNVNNNATNLEGSNEDEAGHSRLYNEDGTAVPCPRIDTQQLDRQIKAIMKEVIPFLKEHMEEVCSPHLLTSIRRMVLTLTQQNDESKEFVKFFHKQLGSILQDSLAKFSNKKLKDCGEDLLVEISEVLFNELAFFRLMQDLDNTSSSVQSRSQQKADADVFQSFSKEAKKIFVGEESAEAIEIDDEDKDKDETETLAKTPTKNIDVSEAHSGRSDISEDEEGNENLPVSISLSKAETQALTNYGSGEDENEEEETYEFEAGPVDVQTSLAANTENTEDHEKEPALNNSPKTTEKCENAEILRQDTGDDQTSEEDQKSSPANISSASVSTPVLLNKEGDTSSSVDVDTKSSLASAESSGPGSPATDSPVLVNEFQETGSGNLSQKSDEDDFVKVEDLPLKLTLPKAELMAEMEKEELKNKLCDEILSLNGNGAEELAGDALSLKEPESLGPHSA